jgi:hypothetical protein
MCVGRKKQGQGNGRTDSLKKTAGLNPEFFFPLDVRRNGCKWNREIFDQLVTNKFDQGVNDSISFDKSAFTPGEVDQVEDIYFCY